MKAIKIIRLTMDDEQQKSMKRIMDQLAKDNYALTGDVKSVRLFARYTKDLVNDNKIKVARVSKITDDHISNIISINPNFNFVVCDGLSFKLSIKK